jgi:uncharacterized protein DUF6580
MQKNQVSKPLAISLIAVGALSRLAPHPPNFTPVGSIALFGGARLAGWQAFAIPLAIMLVADMGLRALFGYPFAFVSYACFMINVLLGRMLRGSTSVGRIAAFAFAGSVQFFLLTNFVTWARGTMYPHTLDGLMTCYIAALPFFAWTVAGDLFFSALLFGAYELLGRRFALQQTAAAR